MSDEVKKGEKKLPVVLPEGSTCGPNKLILEKIDTKENKTEGGIIIPNKDQQDLEHKGTVLAVGSKIEGISVGDVVYHGRHSGTIFAYGKEALLSLNDYEILMHLKK